ncbi:MAG: hypothetical protein C0484_11245 [Rhodospirillum sp.]|nr:hypothetical protein [Rhodospirillum sp.]
MIGFGIGVTLPLAGLIAGRYHSSRNDLGRKQQRAGGRRQPTLFLERALTQRYHTVLGRRPLRLPPEIT